MKLIGSSTFAAMESIVCDIDLRFGRVSSVKFLKKLFHRALLSVALGTVSSMLWS